MSDDNDLGDTSPEAPESKREIVIPKTLEETVPALDKMLSDEDREYIQKSKDVDDVIIRLHHGFGTHLRNTWGLWKGSELAVHLKEVHGIEHPDDMSHKILDHYSRARVKSRYQRLMEDE